MNLRIVVVASMLSMSLHAQTPTFDTSFGNDGKVITSLQESNDYDAITSVFLQPDGKIIACAETEISNNTAVLMRFNADGSPDSGFGTNGKLFTGNYIEHPNENFRLLPDGKMILYGSKLAADFSALDFELRKFNADGSPDTSFGNAGSVLTSIPGEAVLGMAIEVSPDGEIFAAGAVYQNGMDLKRSYVLLKYSANGIQDTSFGTNGMVKDSVFTDPQISEIPLVVKIQPDGKIVVGGNGQNYNVGPETETPYLLRFNPDGSVDTTFGDNGKIVGALVGFNGINAVSFTPGGKIIASGYSYVSGIGKVRILKYNADGTPDTGFGNNGVFLKDVFDDANTDITYNHQILADGKILLIGFSFHNSKTELLLLRLTENGTPDTTFAAQGFFVSSINNANVYMSCFAIQDDDKIVLGGSFDIGSEYYDTILARLNLGMLSVEDKNIGSNFSVLPNPVADHVNLNFQLQQNETLSIDLYDCTGKKIANLQPKTAFAAGASSIRLKLPEAMAKGMYLLKIPDGATLTILR